jgi:hypothetical protein
MAKRAAKVAAAVNTVAATFPDNPAESFFAVPTVSCSFLAPQTKIISFTQILPLQIQTTGDLVHRGAVGDYVIGRKIHV